jgi:hypothetical protein
MAGGLSRILFVAPLLAMLAPASALPSRMPPTDHCARDRGFVVFRNALRAAVARHDAAFVLSVAADNIEYSFGGDPPGRAGFARAWGLAHPATSPLWRELGAALRLGCAHDEAGELWVPSMSLIGDEDMSEDYTRLMVAVGPGAALRAGSFDTSPLVAPLHWDVVTLEGDERRATWLRATLADGRRGYIRRALFRGFDESRAVFAKRHGRWRMTAFVAGD